MVRIVGLGHQFKLDSARSQSSVRIYRVVMGLGFSAPR